MNCHLYNTHVCVQDICVLGCVCIPFQVYCQLVNQKLFDTSLNDLMYMYIYLKDNGKMYAATLSGL